MSGASAAVLPLGERTGTRGELLPPEGGAPVLLGHALGLSLLAARLTLRRWCALAADLPLAA